MTTLNPAAAVGAAPARRDDTDWATHGSMTLILLLGMVNVIDAGIIAALLTPLKATFQLTDEQLARLSSVLAFAGMVGAPVFGWVASRWGRKTAIAIGVAVWSVGCMATGFAGSLAGLLLWRAVTGFGEAAYNGLAPSWLADLYRPKWRALVMSAYMVKNKVATAIALALGGWAAARWGWEAAFLIAGAPGLVLLVAFLFTREPAPGAHDGPGAQPKARASFREGLQVLRHPGFLVHTAAVFLFFAAMNGQGWIPALLHRVHGLGNAQAAGFLAQVLLYTLPAGLVGGFVASRWLRGHLAWFPLFLAVTMLGAAALLFTAYTTSDLATTRWLIGAGTAAFGLSMGPMTTLSMETVPAPLRPHATFLMVPLQGLFGIVVGQAFGWLSDLHGLHHAILLSPVLYGAAGLVWAGFTLLQWRRAARGATRYFDERHAA